MTDETKSKDKLTTKASPLPSGIWRMESGYTSDRHFFALEIREALKTRGDWLIWYLWHSKQATIEQVVLLGTVGPRRALRFARAEDRSVCLAAIEAAEAVAFHNTPENRAAARSASSTLARSAARYWAEAAAWAAAEAAAEAAEKGAEVVARAAAEAAAEAAEKAAEVVARAAAEAAAEAAEVVARAVDKEHRAIADDMRALMRTEKYKALGKKEGH